MSTKHQPCGKPGCINCWPKMPSDPAQAPMRNPLSDYEKNLRDAIILSNQQMQNIAHGSPRYDRVMGTNIHRTAQQQTNKFYADLSGAVQKAPAVTMIDAESFNAGQKDAMRRMAKLIPKITIYFILALGICALAFMVIA